MKTLRHECRRHLSEHEDFKSRVSRVFGSPNPTFPNDIHFQHGGSAILVYNYE